MSACDYGYLEFELKYRDPDDNYEIHTTTIEARSRYDAKRQARVYCDNHDLEYVDLHQTDG